MANAGIGWISFVLNINSENLCEMLKGMIFQNPCVTMKSTTKRKDIFWKSIVCIILFETCQTTKTFEKSQEDYEHFPINSNHIQIRQQFYWEIFTISQHSNKYSLYNLLMLE